MTKWKSLVFWVKGSSDEPYLVEANRSGTNMTMTCTCPAGIYGRTHCKHRLNLLVGDVTNLQGDNFADVNKLADMVAGTDVEYWLAELKQAEDQMKSAKNNLAKTKKALAKAFND